MADSYRKSATLLNVRLADAGGAKGKPAGVPKESPVQAEVLVARKDRLRRQHSRGNRNRRGWDTGWDAF